jgi:hypothetical protein
MIWLKGFRPTDPDYLNKTKCENMIGWSQLEAISLTYQGIQPIDWLQVYRVVYIFQTVRRFEIRNFKTQKWVSMFLTYLVENFFLVILRRRIFFL